MISDQLILSGLRNGDIRIFEELFHRYYPGLCIYAGSLLKRTDLPAEIVQDVFYHLWKNRNEITIRSSLKAYLYKSVYNQSMMHLRKTKREIRLDLDWAEKLPGSHPGPAEELDEKEAGQQINTTLSGLPERTRQIFMLNRMEGLKYREIAEKLSISVKTVESNMGKALKALRASLRESSFFNEP